MTVYYSHPRDDVVVLRLWSASPVRGHIDVTEAELSDIEQAVAFVRQRLAEESEAS